MCTCHTQVCTTLYWLGQAVAELDNYSGPQLNLGAFKHLMEDIVGQKHCAHNLHSLPTPSPNPLLPPFLSPSLPLSFFFFKHLLCACEGTYKEA